MTAPADYSVPTKVLSINPLCLFFPSFFPCKKVYKNEDIFTFYKVYPKINMNAFKTISPRQ